MEELISFQLSAGGTHPCHTHIIHPRTTQPDREGASPGRMPTARGWRSI